MSEHRPTSGENESGFMSSHDYRDAEQSPAVQQLVTQFANACEEFAKKWTAEFLPHGILAHFEGALTKAPPKQDEPTQ